MIREFSAGGVVVRRMSGQWWIAVIQPHHKEAPPGTSSKKPRNKTLLCLPKGLVDRGEKPEAAALREVREETGITARVLAKLADSRYAYVRTWGDGERVFKIVSFYLMLHQAGRIDDISETMRIEVQQALWLPLDDAPKKLAYGGERQIARRAQQYLASHPEV